MKAHQLKVEKTAHYYSIGAIGKNINHVIFALHGYAQSAKKFIHKFDELNDGKTLIICPEGLSRFYWKNFTGDVVASWMTKEDREDDIADNMNYLNSIYNTIISQLNDNVVISFFGFSQACPTLSRWASSQQPHFHHLIMWGGQLAHDENYRNSKDYFSDKKLFFIYGLEDEFLPFGYKERHLSLARMAGMDFEIITYEGKHEIKREVLKDIFNQLQSIQKLF